MPLRTRIFIIVSIVVLGFLGIAIFLVVRSRQAAAPKPTATGTSTTVIDSSNFATEPISAGQEPLPETAGMPVKPATTLEMQQNGVKQLAIIFVERYNSFSTENNFQNIKDVESIVTPVLWKRISTPLTKPAAPNTAFVGVTADVVNASIATWADQDATILVKLHKSTDKSGVTTEQYQNLNVHLVKVGDTWLVDSYATVTP